MSQLLKVMHKGPARQPDSSKPANQPASQPASLILILNPDLSCGVDCTRVWIWIWARASVWLWSPASAPASLLTPPTQRRWLVEAKAASFDNTIAARAQFTFMSADIKERTDAGSPGDPFRFDLEFQFVSLWCLINAKVYPPHPLSFALSIQLPQCPLAFLIFCVRASDAKIVDVFSSPF